MVQRRQYPFVAAVLGIVVLIAQVGAQSLFGGITLAFAAVWVALSASIGYWLGRREDDLASRCATDQLTGLFNRHHFERCLERELANTARHHVPLALFVLDLDSLKAINDVMGHHTGDEAIRSVADALRFTCRANDLAARWGGDEFVLLAPHTDDEQAAQLARRIASTVRMRSACGNPTRLPSVPWVTVSVGFAVARGDRPFTAAALFAEADRAMYRAKALAHSTPDNSERSSIHAAARADNPSVPGNALRPGESGEVAGPGPAPVAWGHVRLP
jgi:diguanylate cyclase (GGDEF)-like protein